MTLSNTRRTWTDPELAMIRNNVKPETRTIAEARRKAKSLGIQFCPEGYRSKTLWTAEEDELVKSGTVPPGRSRLASFLRAKKLGVDSFLTHGGERWARWTPEEVEQIKKGLVPEGRTLKATRAYAFQHRMRFSDISDGIVARTAWKPDEEEQMRSGLVPPGRTLVATKAHAIWLGTRFVPAVKEEPKWKRDGRAEAMHLLRDHGFTMQTIGNWFGVSRERVRQLSDLYSHWLSEQK